MLSLPSQQLKYILFPCDTRTCVHMYAHLRDTNRPWSRQIILYKYLPNFNFFLPVNLEKKADRQTKSDPILLSYGSLIIVNMGEMVTI